MSLEVKGELELTEQGVLYFHSDKTGTTLLRMQKIPADVFAHLKQHLENEDGGLAVDVAVLPVKQGWDQVVFNLTGAETGPVKKDRRLNSGKVAWCPVCGGSVEKKQLKPQPDPYQSEINHDNSPVVQCDDCRHRSAMEI